MQTTGRLALYPGTFDPVHYGHQDIVARAARIFDRVCVGVVDRPSKPFLFDQEQRIGLFRRAVADIENVWVEGYSGLTVDFAHQIGASVLLRGLRSAPDFEFEHQLAGMNRHLRPELETLFMLTAPQRAHLSSSLIKDVAAQGVALNGLVTSQVAAALVARLCAPAQS
jgi:pantetheine-phosphate adenylyltransferase